MESVDMWIVPAMNRDKETDFDQSLIRFNWTAVSLQGSILTVDLNFDAPLYISPLLMQDTIMVNLTNVSSFFSAER